jgi:hypothetical protein
MSISAKNLLLAVLIAGAALGGAGVARATPAEEAEAMIRRGVELRRQGNDSAALQEFRRAYEISASPRAAAQMGLAEQALQSWVDSERHLAEALRARTDPWIRLRKNRETLEESRRTVATHVARIEVGGEPRGGDVFVNGQNAGTLPLNEPVTVAPGPVRIEVRSPGYIGASMTVVVAAGQQSRVDVKLETDRTLTPAASSAGRVPSVRQDPWAAEAQSPDFAPDRAEMLPPVRPAPVSNRLKLARWTALGAATVFLAGGVGGAYYNWKHGQDFNEKGCFFDDHGSLQHPKGDLPACARLVEATKNGETVAIVGFAGAGILALSSALLFFAF